MEAADQLFTAWMTSTTDGHDHAVTDEEFHDHRPEPEAVCGAVLYLAPMEQAPGRRCERCVAFLEGRPAALRVVQVPAAHRHRSEGWLYRLVHASMSPVVPRPRAGARHTPEPSAAARWPSAAAEASTPIVAVRPNSAATAGGRAGEGTPVSSPAPSHAAAAAASPARLS